MGVSLFTSPWWIQDRIFGGLYKISKRLIICISFMKLLWCAKVYNELSTGKQGHPRNCVLGVPVLTLWYCVFRCEWSSASVAPVIPSWINHRLPHVSDGVCDITYHQITSMTGNTSSCCLLAVKDCQLHRQPYTESHRNISKPIIEISWHGNNFLITDPLWGKFPGKFYIFGTGFRRK